MEIPGPNPDPGQPGPGTTRLLIPLMAFQDGALTIDEVVEAYKTFVGSEATNYGEHLLSIEHDEL